MDASRLERAARALLGCNSRAPIGPDESSEWVAVSAEHLDNLRAALALPADAAGSAEAVRAACAAVPALEEARRRRLRWADEAHAQILAVPVPAQPAPDGRGEAVVLLMDVLDALVDCVDGTNSPRHASLEDRVRAFVNRSLPTKLQALPRTHPTPRAEAYAVARDVERRWLATVDALQSRLAAAEAEAERARGLLRECRTAIAASMLVVGTCDADRAAYCAQLLEAVDRARTLGLEACERIDAHLSSRPEGEVRHG